ncbi:MAG: SpoIIE family protein phosphatase [Anaerolineae bacterium]
MSPASNTSSRAPAIVRYNEAAVSEILSCVREGTYCALLGPRLSGKTVLLRYVVDMLSGPLGQMCVYLDLYDVGASTLQSFFADLLHFITRSLEEQSAAAPPLPDPSVASSAVFRGFLGDVVLSLQRDLVLVLEHLEALPTDLIQALLTSLRAAYMDQQGLETRAVVIVSGALSLATVTVGESSPFRGIARRVFVGDLTEAQSAALIAERTATGLSVTDKALQRLLRATSGDPYLIRRICHLSLEAAATSDPLVLRGRTVKGVVRRFLQEEVYSYAPLQEAVRLLEEDPDLLRCILLLLAHGSARRSELPLPLSPDVDPLYLTGVVELVGDNVYRLQNAIYHRFLARHFEAGRVGHLMTMAGRWDQALDYLEAGIRDGSDESRRDLLPATINSMHAAEDIGRAAHFLTRGLSTGFGVVEARVWYALPQENRLRLVGQVGAGSAAGLWAAPEMDAGADRLEARAFRQGRALRGQEVGRHIWRAIPLAVPGSRPVGLVMLCEDRLSGRFSEQRERELHMMGYLSQAARAIQAVSVRRQELALAGRMQASLLPASTPAIPGWQLSAILRPARETSGDFYDLIELPGGRLGIVVADVADKGMGAALYMALSRTLIRTYAADHPDRPDEALEAANKRILADTHAGLFVTVFYGVLDPGAGTLTYCNAGHHPPFLSGPEEGSGAMLRGRGMALGVVPEPGWGHTTVSIPVGGQMFFYTDGIVDALSPEGGRFGLEEALAVVRGKLGRPAAEVQDALLSRLQEFMGDEPQFDDITLVTLTREA